MHSVLQNIYYFYDAVGNIIETCDYAQQTYYFSNTMITPQSKFWYDSIYRLVRATGRELASLNAPDYGDFANNIPVPNPSANAMQNYTQLFVYDELGNIQSMSSQNRWTRTYNYNNSANNYLSSTQVGQDVFSYTYDIHGNMTSMPHLPVMRWDFADRLSEVELNLSGDTAYYIYDSTGNRCRKVVVKGSIREERYYLEGYEVYRKFISDDLDFERQTLHVSDDTKKFATLETKTIENATPVNPIVAEIRYQYDNHLGSACLELDQTAQIISYEEYHPFGTTSYRSGRTEMEVSLKRYKYVGKERDEETGLYYYGARYYAAWICRFVSVDALQFKYPYYTSYQYAGNKPISFIDLDGLEPVMPESAMMPKSDSLDVTIPFEKVTTGFYLKEGDVQAKNDIKNIVNKRNVKYLEFGDDGTVTFTKAFNKLSERKRSKMFKDDEGLTLVYDLVNAKYNENGVEKDAKILYQTKEPFDFSGYLEDAAKMPPNNYSPHTPGMEAVVDVNKAVAWSYNASITKYGVDSKNKEQLTILPQSGFQGQVAIAEGDVLLYYGTKPDYNRFNSETQKWERVRGEAILVGGKKARKDLVMHELRENLFRLSGMNYDDAHNATVSLYQKRFDLTSFKFLQ